MMNGQLATVMSNCYYTKQNKVVDEKVSDFDNVICQTDPQWNDHDYSAYIYLKQAQEMRDADRRGKTMWIVGGLGVAGLLLYLKFGR